MRLYLLAVLLLLGSCSAERHLAKAKKHIEIAKSKGAVIVPDTVWHYSYRLDTVYNNNTYQIKETIVDSFPYIVTNTIKTSLSRQERLAIEDQFKHLERMMRLQNDSLKLILKYQSKNHKQDKKTERVVVRQENKLNPWSWVVLAAIILLIIIVLKYGKSRSI